MTTFEIGDSITGTRDGRTVQAVVLDKAEDTNQLLLMVLPGGEVFEAAAKDVAAWQRAPVPEARWVEVYEADVQTPFFASYLPNFEAAAAVYRAFEARDGDFKVEIYTTLDSENETLDGMGYFGDAGWQGGA